MYVDSRAMQSNDPGCGVAHNRRRSSGFFFIMSSYVTSFRPPGQRVCHLGGYAHALVISCMYF